MGTLRRPPGRATSKEHVAAFRPTATVLVLHHPVDQISTLTRESYRDYATPIESKLAVERAFSTRQEFDVVLELFVGAGSYAVRDARCRQVRLLGDGVPASRGRQQGRPAFKKDEFSDPL